MKRLLRYLLVPVLTLAALGCQKEELVFDHELPAFETRDGMILIEAIMPTNMDADNEIYIVGPFNGGEDAVGNIAYQLEKSTRIPLKWGVYLNPSSFVDGKTLADGFWFVCKKEGREMTALGREETHSLKASAGNRYNVFVSRWASAFIEPGEETLPEHEGVRIYIIDETGWDAIALYQWGDVNNMGGNWPGAQVAGTATLAGRNYPYFEYGDDIFGLSQHLIFNNNGAGIQLSDYDVTFSEGIADYFLRVTAEGVVPFDNPVGGGGGTSFPTHDGVRIYAVDQTGWDAIALYQWGDVNDFGGGWPGAQVAGTFSLGGVDYVYFEYGDDIIGLSQHLIFNNNGAGTQLGDYDLTFEEGVKDYFLLVTPDGVSAYDPGGGGGPVEPVEPPINPSDYASIYILDNTGWNEFTVYSWGDDGEGNNIEAFGSWPGAKPYEKVMIGEDEYSRILFSKDALGTVGNLIFSNGGGGVQFDGPVLELKDEMFLNVTVTNDVVVITDPRAVFSIYVRNDAGWSGIATYGWADGAPELFGGWPGAQPLETLQLGGDAWYRFEVNSGFNGKEYNLIFNNNGGGTQTGNMPAKLDSDHFYVVSATGVEEVGPPAFHAYVNDMTGWSQLNLYMWGDVNDLGGGWPGFAPAGTETIEGIEYKVFEFPFEWLGLRENLIFNNNEGAQTENYPVTFTGDFFVMVTAAGASDPTLSRFSIYVHDAANWTGAGMYGWATGEPELYGSWPGTAPAETISRNGRAWYRFDVPQSANGKTYNVIFNGSGGQVEGFACEFTRDYWLEADGVFTEVDTPGFRIYVDDKTGWDVITMYMWGDVNDLGGSWPGMSVTGTETIGGIGYKYFQMLPEWIGMGENLIFNNGGNGIQHDNYSVTFIGDLFLEVTSEGVSAK